MFVKNGINTNFVNFIVIDRLIQTLVMHILIIILFHHFNRFTTLSIYLYLGENNPFIKFIFYIKRKDANTIFSIITLYYKKQI